MANRQQRRHPAKRQGMNFADELQRQRMVKELAAEAAKDKMVKVQTEIRTQKTLWLAYVALNDEFQFGADRIERFAQQLMKRSEWFEKISQEDGDDVADEKLRREIQRIMRTSVSYVYEDEISAAKAAEKWQPENLYERIRMMDMDKMARFITEEVLGLEGPTQELEESRWKRKLREREHENRVN